MDKGESNNNNNNINIKKKYFVISLDGITIKRIFAIAAIAAIALIGTVSITIMNSQLQSALGQQGAPPPVLSCNPKPGLECREDTANFPGTSCTLRDGTRKPMWHCCPRNYEVYIPPNHFASSCLEKCPADAHTEGGKCVCNDPNSKIVNGECKPLVCRSNNNLQSGTTSLTLSSRSTICCPEGQCPTSSGRCELPISNENCGTCSNACNVAAGLTCRGSTCQCPQGQNTCNGQCVDTSIDPNNCGGCGINCAQTVGAGATCNNGQCQCPQGKEVFNGQCVPICPEGQTRDPTTGQCQLEQCPDGQIVCDGECVDTRTDIEHCGGCGKACGTEGVSSKLQCQSGSCTCEPGSLGLYPRYQYCENVGGTGMAGCTDKASDRYNCGTDSCGNVCGSSCTGQGTCIS